VSIFNAKMYQNLFQLGFHQDPEDNGNGGDLRVYRQYFPYRAIWDWHIHTCIQIYATNTIPRRYASGNKFRFYSRSRSWNYRRCRVSQVPASRNVAASVDVRTNFTRLRPAR